MTLRYLVVGRTKRSVSAREKGGHASLCPPYDDYDYLPQSHMKQALILESIECKLDLDDVYEKVFD